jgi:hypothetical protein
MRSLISGVLFMVLALSTSACNSSMKTPDIKHNPHPKMRYEITLAIQDAPGPFESVTGFMQYEVANEECAPKDTFAGVYRKPPIQHPPIVFTRMSDFVYTGTLYLDLMRDEDYYGLGVCHWAMTAAIVEMKANGAVFSTSTSLNDVTSQKSSTEYLWKKAYLDPASRDGSGNSVPLIDAVKQHPASYFSATLTAKEDF